MSDLEHSLAPTRVAELLERDQAVLIDVREPDELSAGRIPGSRHVELTELPARAETIPRDRPVVFYCRSGNRSAMAVEAFRGAGYDAHSLEGGLEAWAAAQLPIETDG